MRRSIHDLAVISNFQGKVKCDLDSDTSNSFLGKVLLKCFLELIKDIWFQRFKILKVAESPNETLRKDIL